MGNHKLSTWLTFIVAVLVIIGVVFWNMDYFKKHQNNPNQNQTTQNNSAKPTPPDVKNIKEPVKTEAKTGEVIAGFPNALIINSNKILESYSMKTDAGSTQNTVRFTTSKPIVDEYNAYLKYIQDAGYKVVAKNQSTTSANIYSYNDTANVSLLIAKVGNENQVTVNYLSTPKK